MDERTVTIPLPIAAAISRYLGTRPYDEVHEVLPFLRTICEQAMQPEKKDANPENKLTVV